MRIRQLTERSGRTDVSLAPIAPGMEDVFVSLIEKEDRINGKGR